MNENLIGSIFSQAGKRYGFDTVTADFSPEKDLKIAWIRCGSQIDLWISDYLKDAPSDLLEDLADVVFRKIKLDPGIQYTDVIKNYVESKDFRDRCRPTYISRLHGVSLGTEGRHFDLNESYERLAEKGLIDMDSDIILRWAPITDSPSVGHSSALMKVVTLSRRLDCVHISTDVLDFCLYSQLSLIGSGRLMDKEDRDREYEEKMRQYPGYSCLMEDLRELGMDLGREMSPIC